MNAHFPNALLPAEALNPPVPAFGQVLAPNAVVAQHGDAAGWSEASVMAQRQTSLPAASGALQYGFSVFEGLKVYRRADGGLHLFRPDAHAARMAASARRLGMPPVPEALFRSACMQAARANLDSVPAYGRGALYLRPTLYADEPALGFRTARSHGLVVLATPAADPLLKSLRLWAEPELTRAAPGGLGAAKTGANYAAGLLGLLRAREQDCDDVAWLDAATHRRLAEAGTMNLFVEIDHHWYTPPLDGTILAGVTRDALMQLMRAEGLRVEERELDLRELIELERLGRVGGAIGTGTAARVVRISAIRGPRNAVAFHDRGHAERFAKLLKQAQEGDDARFADWCLPLLC